MASSAPAGSCSHLSWVRQPNEGTAIHKEECTQCFHTDATEGGIDVCLNCFNGGCTGAGSMHHSGRHASLCHPLVLNIRKRDIIKPESDASMTDAAAEAPAAKKPTKLAIGGAGGVEISDEPQHYYEHEVRCLECKVVVPTDASDALNKCVKAVLESHSATRPTAMGWEDEVKEDCTHCKNLQQVSDPPQLQARSAANCASCDVKDAMWLCLTCGALGCSRKQMMPDGSMSNGNGHAVAHAEATGHALVLKMGTLSAEGKGDCYCYKCDDTVVDTKLADHVATFGLRVGADTVVTEKSMADLQLDWNLAHNWSVVFDEEGREAELAFGPGHTGLANLGNSCYLASVLQVLFALPSFQQRYHAPAEHHLSVCQAQKPDQCFQCQMSKLALGLLSGRYDPQPSADEMAHINAERQARKALKEGGEQASAEDSAAAASLGEDSKKRKKPLQQGVPPRMFKTLIAGKHKEFSTAKQQDSFEYLHFLLDYIKQKEHSAKFDPYAPFAFTQEDRLECANCHRVRYSTVRNTELSLGIPLPEPLPPKEAPAAAATTAAPAEVTSDSASASAAPAGGDKPKAAAPKPAPKEYPPVSFSSCLDEWTHTTTVDAWVCPHCQSAQQARKSSRFSSFPSVLVVHMRRFVYEGWVPEKLDIEVRLTEGEEELKKAQTAQIDLEKLRAKGLQAGEELLPKEAAAAPAAAAKVADPAIVSGLEAMGFGSNACKRAALAVDNASADAAASWLFANMDAPDLNDPLPAPAAAPSAGGAGAAEPPADAVANLEAMGFDTARCKYALRQCGNSAERAVEWLFSHAEEDLPAEGAAAAAGSAAAAEPEDPVMIDAAPAGYELFAFITHMGRSTGSGHYIAHVRKQGRWLQFNDHKVSFATQPMRAAAYAYLLFFRRIAQ